MQLLPTQRPHLAASTDTTRAVLNHTFLQGNTLVATDGRRLVATKVTLDDNDADGFVPVAALKKAHSTQGAHNVGANGDIRVPLKDGGTITTARPTVDDTGHYPNWRQVFPDYPLTPIAIPIDAKLLHGLAQSMTTTGTKADQRITLVINADNPAVSPLIVLPADRRSCGVLMPCKDQNTHDSNKTSIQDIIGTL